VADTAYRAEPGTRLTPAQLAFSFGFEAASLGRPKSDNPHLLPGDLDWRPAGELAHAWCSGWYQGQGQSLSALSWHLHVCRGGD
jgi:hypothetical protein